MQDQAYALDKVVAFFAIKGQTRKVVKKQDDNIVEAVALYRKIGFKKNTDATLAQGHDTAMIMAL